MKDTCLSRNAMFLQMQFKRNIKIFTPVGNIQLYKIQISLPGEVKVEVYFWKFP